MKPGIAPYEIVAAARRDKTVKQERTILFIDLFYSEKAFL
jgi:hypothetical protein